ncbi:DNA-binding transcriptional LysR family regulator [Paenibacillus cellulosilyticus]|uniref:DNA-binding transcriptional LysR family regulator n=1 Tax=Paenibacillus cellulosilyticus TaxID=375489 RepID=A0A2V2YQ14_9BACL|nr:LysR family transcriptional regulator [Paenibacillus cellulosilyticus]PWV95582.1 DNA-binding transcriptional LysR family regulator [Paenibacillus cellulosilyticus]QKS47346.1 LysR family transcriptional regulator [Paenibacillus cellulosilyticus]
MDMKQLRYFIALAEELQVTSAANRLHMSQPPLSQQLKLMETELGVPLFIRNGRHLELTAPGQTLYEYALTITRLMDQAQAEVRESGLGLRGKLSVGVNTLSDERLPQVLSTFRELYPNVTFRIQQNETRMLAKLVKEKALDLAIVRLPIALDDFDYVELGAEPLYFVTTDPLDIGASEAVSYAQIAQHSLVLPTTEGLGLYHLILEQFHMRGLSPVVAAECSDIGMLMELVVSGFGASILPGTSLRRYGGHRLHVYTIDGPQDLSRSALIWPKAQYLSKAAQRLIELLKPQSDEIRQNSQI